MNIYVNCYFRIFLTAIISFIVLLLYINISDLFSEMSKKVFNLNIEDDVQEVIRLLAITDDMGENSDLGGDSDPEDGDFMSSSSRSTPLSCQKLQTRAQLTTVAIDDDDDSAVVDNIPAQKDPFLPGPSALPTLSLSLDEEITSETEKIYHWSKQGKKPQKFAKFKFSEHYGPSNSAWVNLDDPFSVFSLFFSEKIISDIVRESNLYAEQNYKQFNLSNEEFLAFFGMLIIMGFHILPSLRHYWSTDINLHVQRISDIMSLKRFLKIFRYIHLNDNNKMPKRGTPNFDVLYKVSPLVKELNSSFKNLFDPSRYLAIDESMVKFKGRSSIKQYMPMKPVKRGFKVWALCCSESGYALDLSIYTGKSGKKPEPLGKKVVKNLSAPYLGKGQCIFFDNFFSDVSLSNFLLEKNTFSVGTIRPNRKNYPKNLKCDKDMIQSEIDFAQCDDTSIIKWKDRGTKSVSVISTMHNPLDTSEVSRNNKDGTSKIVTCPNAIVDYNKYMGGVDRFDQLLETYNLSWKSRRWWMRIFFYFLDASIVNSYVIYKETLLLSSPHSKPISHLAFRSKLASNMIGYFSSRQKPGVSPSVYGQARKKDKRARTSSVPNRTKFSNLGEHLPIKGTSRRCSFCSTSKNPKRSQIICRKCEVALCLECFAPFHES